MIPVIAATAAVVVGLGVVTWRQVRRAQKAGRLEAQLAAAFAAQVQAEQDAQLQVVDGWIVERTRNPYLVNLHCGTCSTSRYILSMAGNRVSDDAIQWGIDNMPDCHDDNGVRLNDE